MRREIRQEIHKLTGHEDSLSPDIHTPMTGRTILSRKLSHLRTEFMDYQFLIIKPSRVIHTEFNMQELPSKALKRMELQIKSLHEAEKILNNQKIGYASM
jgi:hypothetical protein